MAIKKGGFPVPANHPTAAKAKAFEKIAGSFQWLSTSSIYNYTHWV
jgi:hypothetical protein